MAGKTSMLKKVGSTRRTGTLQPKDFDHEIDLIDHEGNLLDRESTPDPNHVSRSSTTAGLLERHHEEAPTVEDGEPSRAARRSRSSSSRSSRASSLSHGSQHPSQSKDARRPSIELQQPTPEAFCANTTNIIPKKKHVERETVIDILYQNERGGFLCGRALFSEAALGGLDATPWTNAYHHSSPTSIQTATVPDPSWEWVWPEWRINHQDGMDEGGWEYSFAYGKKFSWHGPKWWNSFVRRRAWIRKRAKKLDEEIPTDMHMLNTDYFLVQPASLKASQSHTSGLSSRASNAPSMSQISSVSGEARVLPDIQDTESLLLIMKKSRIDREKLEAVENYLENATDLTQMKDEMHSIMSLFVFQASRRLLLSRLMQTYDGATEALKDKDEAEVKARRHELKEAIKHADEEVKRLAYWSDVKQMAENGESRGAADDRKGWDEDEWEGIDQSGPSPPNNRRLPSGSQ